MLFERLSADMQRKLAPIREEYPALPMDLHIVLLEVRTLFDVVMRRLNMNEQSTLMLESRLLELQKPVRVTHAPPPAIPPKHRRRRRRSR